MSSFHPTAEFPLPHMRYTPPQAGTVALCSCTLSFNFPRDINPSRAWPPQNKKIPVHPNMDSTTKPSNPYSTSNPQRQSPSASSGIPLKRADGLVLILDTPKGRGVFASRDIPGRTVLEVCPVLVLDPVENEDHIRKTALYHYTYNWPYTPPQLPPPNSHQHSSSASIPRKQIGTSSSSSTTTSNPTNSTSTQNTTPKPPTTTQAIILGLGSMFNHSTLNQNVGWERDLTKQLITYTALRDLKAGEELCISYGQRLTFRDTEEEARAMQPDDWTEVMNYIDYIG